MNKDDYLPALIVVLLFILAMVGALKAYSYNMQEIKYEHELVIQQCTQEQKK